MKKFDARTSKYEGTLQIGGAVTEPPELRFALHAGASRHWPLLATIAFVIVFNGLAWASLVLLVMAAL